MGLFIHLGTNGKALRFGGKGVILGTAAILGRIAVIIEPDDGPCGD
jgi:hypothetical protein